MTVDMKRIYRSQWPQPQLEDNGACRVEGTVHRLKHVNIRGNWTTACGLCFEQHHQSTPDQRATNDPVNCLICIDRDKADRW